MNPFAIAAAVLGAGATAAGVSALRTPTPDPEGSNSGASMATTAFARLRSLGSSEVFRNTGDLPTREQVLAWLDKVRRPHSDAERLTIVRRVRTPIPGPGHQLDPLRELLSEASDSNRAAGFILTALAAVETGAGHRPNSAVACYNYNLGNQKAPRSVASPRQVYFLVDRVPSLDFYPSFDGFATYASNAWIPLLKRPHYARHGAWDAAKRGDIVGFCRAIGAGGYARAYAQDAELLRKVAVANVRRGRLTPVPEVGL